MKNFIVISLIMIGLLSVETLMAEDWDFPLTVETPDTSWEVVVGVRPSASAEYNLLFDIPYIGTPLDAAAFFEVYFPQLNMPIWLTTDRKKGDGIYLPWKLKVGIGAGLSNRIVRWNSTNLPAGNWTMTTNLGDTAFNMAEVDSFTFSFLNTVKIVRAFRPIIDPTGPVIAASTPADGDTGVPINTSIRITLIDEESWVDDTTITVTVAGNPVISTAYLAEKGYMLWVEMLFDLPPDSNIVVEVRSKNVADTPVESIQTFSFRTSNETAIYSLSGTITCADSGSPEGAMVNIFENDTLGDTLVASDTVDSSGEYYLFPLNSGVHTIKVNLSGYKEVSLPALIILEDQKRDFTLQPEVGIQEPLKSEKLSTSIITCPNPFSSSTSIRYSVARVGNIELKIHNIAGQLVKTLVNEKQNPGSYSTIWDGRDNNGKILPSGIYFYKLKIGDKFSQSASGGKKLLLLR